MWVRPSALCSAHIQQPVWSYALGTRVGCGDGVCEGFLGRHMWGAWKGNGNWTHGCGKTSHGGASWGLESPALGCGHPKKASRPLSWLPQLSLRKGSVQPPESAAGTEDKGLTPRVLRFAIPSASLPGWASARTAVTTMAWPGLWGPQLG